MFEQKIENPTVIRDGRVAVLVDGENISQALAGQIITKALAFGQLQVKRVYGNAALLPKWDAAPGFRLVHSGTGKNATDILMTVEAMALACGRDVDKLVIVSSDRDFTHLADHVRERGMPVIGMGEAKTHESFRKACTQFVTLGAVVPPATAAAQVVKFSALDEAIHKVIASHGTDGRMIGLGMLGNFISKDHGVTHKDTGCKTWKNYFQANTRLYRLTGEGPTLTVAAIHPLPAAP